MNWYRQNVVQPHSGILFGQETNESWQISCDADGALETWCLVREESQLQNTYDVSPLTWQAQNKQQTEAADCGWQKLEMEGRVTTLMGLGLFEGDEMVWARKWWMIGKHYKYIKCHSVVCFKWLTWWILRGDFYNQTEGKRQSYRCAGPRIVEPPQ